MVWYTRDLVQSALDIVKREKLAILGRMGENTSEKKCLNHDLKDDKFIPLIHPNQQNKQAIKL